MATKKRDIEKTYALKTKHNNSFPVANSCFFLLDGVVGDVLSIPSRFI
ncbi:MAG: hypothetical protein NZ954_08450 [Thermofilaceae archaeon]|nr:hypothetical protein [Thermofilaceae archaeon]